MAAKRKSEVCYNPDRENLNWLISNCIEPEPDSASFWGKLHPYTRARNGITFIDAQTMLSKTRSWIYKYWLDGDNVSPVDWHSDNCWPRLLRDDGALCLEWDGKVVIVYFTRTRAKMHRQACRGTDVGDVVCRAWARMKGLVR